MDRWNSVRPIPKHRQKHLLIREQKLKSQGFSSCFAFKLIHTKYYIPFGAEPALLSLWINEDAPDLESKASLSEITLGSFLRVRETAATINPKIMTRFCFVSEVKPEKGMKDIIIPKTKIICLFDMIVEIILQRRNHYHEFTSDFLGSFFKNRGELARTAF